MSIALKTSARLRLNFDPNLNPDPNRNHNPNPDPKLVLTLTLTLTLPDRAVPVHREVGFDEFVPMMTSGHQAIPRSPCRYQKSIGN